MNQINGYTRVCGLFGNPVEHTMSPFIHNFIAEQTNINLAYVPFRIYDGYLEDAVKGAYALNLLGVNVTVPYKTDVIKSLVDIDELAKAIGAVNTLVRVEGGYKGYNTDMPGLHRAMLSDGVKIEGESIVIIGAGGVARAVAMLMAREAKEIIILNRTIAKAEAIAEEVNAYVGRKVVTVHSLNDFEDLKGKKYLAIQATNVGMFPKIDEAAIEDADFYNMIHTGYDLIFNPLDTKFMKLTKNAGGRAFNGLKMLLYQGIIAYELWTETSISESVANATYEGMLRSMINAEK